MKRALHLVSTPRAQHTVCGLGFDPHRDRRVPTFKAEDICTACSGKYAIIAGTVWLDSAPVELR